MTEHQPERMMTDMQSNVAYPIAAARPLTDFASERVGDDLILFDGETMQYHTLNGAAERIWRSCDGAATVESIAASTELPVDVVETTVAELGEASLLQTPASTWSIPMNRRRAAKLIAAGAVGVPVVLSITTPSASAAWSGDCTPGQPCPTGVSHGEQCIHDFSNWHVYCCYGNWWAGTGGCY